MTQDAVTLRLVFADEGSFHHEELSVPRSSLADYERLIDALREEPSLLARLHVDLDRLCAAYLLEGDQLA